MQKIQGLQDIHCLRIKGSSYRRIAEYLQAYWLALAQEEDFPPKHYIPMVFLDSPADAENLECMGLPKRYRDSHPEYVELIDLMDGTRLYNACILLNNEDAINIFSIQGALDMETELFLQDECD